LPHSDHTYQQAPYQDIEADDYNEWQVSYGKLNIDWEALSEYEREDNTSGSRELACMAGVCEVVDLNAA
jgi:ribonucleoside-diphosphate reductase alpha chain